MIGHLDHLSTSRPCCGQIKRVINTFIRQSYPANRGFSLAWVKAFIVSLAWLVNRVAGLIYTVCTTQEKLAGRIKQTNYATDKPHERDRKR